MSNLNNGRKIKKEFQYIIINKYKQKIDGIIEREDINKRKSTLSLQGSVLSIKEKKNFFNSKNANLSSYKLDRKCRIEFFEELLISTEIGISLSDTMYNIKINQILDVRIRNLRSVCFIDLEKGLELSTSLKKRKIPEYLREIVKTGEQRGKLEERFKTVIELDNVKTDISSALMSIFMLPTIMLVVSTIAYYLIGTKLMPKIKENFLQVSSNPEKFPESVKLIFNIYDDIGLYLIAFYRVIFSSIGIFVFMYKSSKNFRMSIRKKLIKLPLINKFIVLQDLTIISRMLSLTISSGLPKKECIEHSIKQISNLYIKSQMENINTLVKNGKNISDAMRDTNFDGTLTVVVKQGEVRGDDKLVEILNKTSRGYIKKIYLNITKLKETKGIIQMLLMVSMFLPLILSLIIPQSQLLSFAMSNLK